jgi:hypothetical protein
MAGEPVFWGRVELGWTPEGYIADFPLWAEQRCLYEYGDELRQVIGDALGDHPVITVGLEPMVVTRTKSSHDAEPGRLQILTQTMLLPAEGVALRQAVTPFLQSAIEATGRLIEADDKAAALLKESLRQPDTDSPSA